MASSPTPNLLTRLGMAIVSPRAAMTLADDPTTAGRAGSDLTALLALVLLCGHLRRLVGAVWLGFAADVGVGFRGLIAALAQALTLPLAFVVIASLVIFVLAGRRRLLGRAFDLASVAVVPLLLLELSVTAGLRLSSSATPSWLVTAVGVVGFSWATALAALGLWQARRAPAGAVALLPSTKRSRTAGFAIALVLLVSLVAEVRWIAINRDLLRPLRQGDEAPALALRSVDEHGTLGAITNLAELRGQVVVVEFWATWCQPCLRSLPGLAELAASHKSRGLQVLTVNLDDPAGARTLLDTRRLALPVLADDGETSARYGVSSIPHLVVIGRDGRVLAVHRGGVSPDDLAAQVDRALGN